MPSNTSLLTSDTILFLLLLFLSLFALHLIRPIELCRLLFNPRHNPRPGPHFLESAVHAYAHYAQLCHPEIAAMRASYGTLSRAHKRIGYELGYTKKLNRLEEVTGANARLTRKIAEFARETSGLQLGEWNERWIGPRDVGKVREALRHFVRDWSEEGREERATIFTPILERLKQDGRRDMKVLVPGAGLGRLAWEIAQLGYDTTANELSPSMLLPLHFLFSPITTPHPNHHTIHPYAHWFSHSPSPTSLFRSVSFPDVVPRWSERLRLVEGDFHLLDEEGGGGFDRIVTLFFIDTSFNIIKTLQTIFFLLNPGGEWINLGPLLWSPTAQAAMELSLEEMIDLAKVVGFRFEEGEEGGKVSETVECEYTADREAMMRWVYKAEYWVARKPGVCWSVESSSFRVEDGR